jgi:hypothetical protein
MKKLKVLIACESSGVVRRAFRALGHDAWSCDILPADDGSEHHIHDDAFSFYALGERAADWDLVIAHPPCTYLCNSGVRWLAPGGVIYGPRHIEMQKGADFFARLYWCKARHVAVENPVMHKYARDYLASAWKVPSHSCTFQPWQHGEGEVKRTCLWLRGLPDLVPSHIVAGREARVHKASPGPLRWKARSATLEGPAKAMAQQFSKYILAQP